MLNKPRDLEEARGCSCASRAGPTRFTPGSPSDRRIRGSPDDGVASEVTFKALDGAEIADYLSKVETLDKAGGYSVQDQTDLIIAGYTGSFTNIMGFRWKRRNKF